MPEVREPSVTAAVERILETMCFSTVLGRSQPAEARDYLSNASRLDFHGQSRGTIWVGLSHAGASELASSFLGENDVEEERLAQFTGELANMICGAIVSEFAQGGQYTLSSPVNVDPEELAKASGVRADFTLEVGYLSVVARTE